MNRKRSYWLAIGPILCTALTSVSMGIAAAQGFGAGSGDIMISSSNFGPLNLALVMVGLTALIGLEAMRSASRRSGRRSTAQRVTEAAQF